MKMYEYPKEFREIDDLLELSGGELTPEIEARLEAAEAGFQDKVRAIAILIRLNRYHGDDAAAEAVRLQKVARVARNKVEALGRYLMDVYDQMALNSTRVPGFGTVRVQKNSQDSIRCVREVEELPDDLVRVKREPDLVRVREIYEKAGVLPHGFVAERGRHIRID